MGEHGFGCAVVGDASVGTKHDDAVHMLRPHAHPVFDDDQGGTGYRDRLHHGIAHLLDALGVEVRGGFVQQNGARVHRQDSGEPQALFLPARKRIRGLLMRQVVEPDGGERIVNARPDFFACDHEVFGAEGYVITYAGEHDR